MEASVQQIFAQHFPSWAHRRRMPLHYHKAASALSRCRTTAMGTHKQRCPSGHYETEVPNACRSRSCPRCAALARERWVESQKEKLLGCEHYHVVFTLPHALLPLFTAHRRVLVDILFDSVRETMLTLLRDPRYLGAEPGLLLALHTWGRTLSHHPHIHCLTTAGGLTADGRWRAAKDGYLLPVHVVKALYRGKFLGKLKEALRAGRLMSTDSPGYSQALQLLKELYKLPWHVRLKERYAHGEGVMKYLARYVKGGPISNQRLVRASDEHVTFRYRDHHDGREKLMALGVDDFMARVLWHLPEPYQHAVRTAGLYSNRANEKRACCRQALGQRPARRPETLTWRDYLRTLGHGAHGVCPTCGQDLVS